MVFINKAELKTSCDVVIVGASPAGLACANELKNSKLSVLIIEKIKQ